MAEAFQAQVAEEQLEQEQRRRRVLDARLAVAVRRITRSGRRADYIDAVHSLRQRLTRVALPVQCDVDTAQAFRDASREEIMLNGVCFVGDHRTEAFVAAVKRIVSRHVEQPESYLAVTDRILRGCSRTLSGADSYFALHQLFADPDLLIKPRSAKAVPLSATLGLDFSGERVAIAAAGCGDNDACATLRRQTTASGVASNRRTCTGCTATTTSTRCCARASTTWSRSSRSTLSSSSKWT